MRQNRVAVIRRPEISERTSFFGHPESIGDWIGNPRCMNAKIGQDYVRGIVRRQARDVAAGMTAGTTQVQAVEMSAIMPGAGERAMITDLSARKRTDQQIALVHVPQCALNIQWAARE